VLIRIGTSGFSFPKWRGSFYPKPLPSKDWLSFYAQHLPTVEVNNTFHRMPSRSVLERWGQSVVAGFVFALKAPQRITHYKRLLNVGEDVEWLCRTASVLGPSLGPVLFQLPPHLPKDLGRLAALLDALPSEIRAAFEFRHASWHDEEVRALLRSRPAALCVADVEGADTPTVQPPAGAFGYLRLRRGRYTEAALRDWIQWIRAQAWQEAFVYFKHEEDAPALAQRMLALAG